MIRCATACLAMLATASVASALVLPPVTHEATVKECSACHMVYAPQMLPARSWQALMGDLANHFGESAVLDAATQTDISNYLLANAADAPGNEAIRGLLRGLQDTDIPLRITEMPWWKGSHGEVSPASYKRANVKSASNCVACHRGADKGNFSEE
jgi:hypothetical protein